MNSYFLHAAFETIQRKCLSVSSQTLKGAETAKAEFISNSNQHIFFQINLRIVNFLPCLASIHDVETFAEYHLHLAAVCIFL